MAKRKLRPTDVGKLEKTVQAGVRCFQEALRRFQVVNGITSRDALAERLGLPKGNVQAYLPGEGVRIEPALPSVESLRKIRGRLTDMTDADAKVIKQGFEARMTLKHHRGLEKRWGLALSNNQPKLEVKKALLWKEEQPQTIPILGQLALTEESSRLIAELLATDLRSSLSGCVAQPAAAAAPMPGMPGIACMPLILTHANFREIDGHGLSAERLTALAKEGVCILQAACQFFNFLSQLGPERVRVELLKQIGRETNELVLAMLAAKDLVPSQAIELVEAQRQFCSNL